MQHTRETVYIGLLILGSLGSYLIGKADAGRLVAAENQRVTAAVARMLRCQSEAEYDAGIDHQCTADEIRQDAGLEAR